MNEELFNSIRWPQAFTVEYLDGRSEVLERGVGVSFGPAEDDPMGRASFSASVPRKSKHQRRQVGRVAYLDEVKRIVAATGAVLWERDSCPGVAAAAAERSNVGRRLVIIEHELLEQIEDQAPPRSLEWACLLLASLGKTDPLAVLRAMHHDGLIDLRGADGAVLAAWQARSVLRGQSQCERSCSITATKVGSRRAHGDAP